MSREPYLKSYVDAIFDVTVDPTAAQQAAAYIGEHGTFSILRQGVADFCLYTHDEVTQGGWLIACTSGGGGGGSTATLVYDPNAYTLTFNNGAGQLVTFDSGEISAEAGNTLVRSGVDGGLYVPQSAVPDVTQRITSDTILAVTPPPAGQNGVVFLAPVASAATAAGLTYVLADGTWEGQRLTVIMEYLGNTPSVHQITTSISMPRTVDSFGKQRVNSGIRLVEGRSVELLWRGLSGGPSGWFIASEYDSLKREDKLVFSGIPRPNTFMAPGWDSAFLLPIFDPKQRWDFANRTWTVMPDDASYRIEISLLGAPLAGSPFTAIWQSTGAGLVTPLLPPVSTSPNEYSYHWTGHALRLGPLNAPQNALPSMRLFNASGVNAVFNPAENYVALGRWQLNIYETNNYT